MINAGLLGLGWWGKLIIDTLEDSNKIRVTSASSRTMEKHKKYLEENKINAFPTYEQMLEDDNIDAIIICTPNSQHEDQLRLAIKAKKQVFCEKPMALSRSSAENMIRIADENNYIIGIGHERRYDPAIVKLKSIIDDDSFGEKMHIEANWSHRYFSITRR